MELDNGCGAHNLIAAQTVYELEMLDDVHGQELRSTDCIVLQRFPQNLQHPLLLG
jgi:hypothetical protein